MFSLFQSSFPFRLRVQEQKFFYSYLARLPSYFGYHKTYRLLPPNGSTGLHIDLL
jgi:hypothetical protein